MTVGGAAALARTQTVRRLTGWPATCGFGLLLSVILAATVSPAAGIAATASLLLAALMLARPDVLPLALACLVMGVWYYALDPFVVRLLGFNWYPADWLIVLALAGLAVRAAIGRPLAWTPGVRLFWPAAFQTVVMTGMALHGLASGNARANVFFDLRPFAYYSCALLTPCLLGSPERVVRFAWVGIYAGMVGGVWGIVRSLTGPGFHIYGLNLQFARLIGPSEIVYPLALLSALGMLVLDARPERRGLLFLSVLIQVIACFLTYSRGTYLALGLGFVAMLLLVGLRSRRRMIETFVFAVVSVGAMIVVLQAIGIPLQQSFVERTKSISLENVDLSIAQRLLEWNDAYRTFRAHPVFGAGLGHLNHFYLPPYGWYTYNYCHNSYLYVLSKTGAVGFLCFAFFLASWGGTHLRAYLRAPTDEIRGVMLGWAGGFLYLLMKATTTWMLNIDFWAPYFAFVIGGTTLIAWWRPADSARS